MMTTFSRMLVKLWKTSPRITNSRPKMRRNENSRGKESEELGEEGRNSNLVKDPIL